MASYQYINSSNQVRDSRFTDSRHGYSKSQMCLFKILHIISSVSPCQNSKEVFLSCGDDNHKLGSFASRGIGIDLNLSSAAADNEESEYLGSESVAEAVREKSVEVSEVTNVQVVSFDNGYDREETKFEESISVDGEEENRKCHEGGMETAPFEGKRHENNNCLDLLIEAAKVISENSAQEDSNFEEPSVNRGLSNDLITNHMEPARKRNQNCMVVDLYSELNDMSPVVKSKRGRSQALPFRFRDSVVEPLKRSARPQRQSSTATSGKRPIGS